MVCPRCSNDVRGNERHCSSCNKDIGYPNVRAAKEPDEKAALALRFRNALQNASVQGRDSVVLAFLAELKSSVAVICRSFGKVKELVSSSTELYASFYQLIGAGARRLEGTKMDLERRIADAIIFPYYEQDVRFASLSLDGLGVTEYGDCSMVLKDVAISERATVFEENSVYFCKKFRLGVADLLPPGYRATWDDRGMLAVSKLEPEFTSGTTAAEFASILSARSGQDFVEVHIFDKLDRGSIERIIARSPETVEDKALLRIISRHSKVEIVS